MRLFNRIVGLTSVLLAVVFLSAAAQAASYRGTIKLKDGATYENVEYRIDQVYKVVVIKPLSDSQQGSAEETTVSMERVALVLDENGNDITAEVLGTLSAGDEYTMDKRAAAIHAMRDIRWEVTLSAYPSYGFLLGDYFEGLSGDLGYDLAVNFLVSKDVSIRVGLGRTGMDVGSEYRFYSIDPSTVIVDQDISFHALRYYVAGQYNMNLNKKDTTVLSTFYAYTGLGAVSLTGDLAVTVRNSTSGVTSSLEDSYSETKFAMIGGLGVTLGFGRSPLGADLGLNWDLIFVGKGNDNNYLYSDIVYAHIFTLHAGLVLYL